MNFNSDLKSGLLVNKKHAKFIWLGNIEVEQYWRDQSLQSLPGSKITSSNALINRMGEMALFLAEEEDIVCVKYMPDPDFLLYVREIRGDLPKLLCCENSNPEENISQSILKDEVVLAALRELANNDYYLIPYGASQLEEQLSAATGLPLSAPASSITAFVNSKVYSRHLCDRTNIHQVIGDTVHSLTELEDKFEVMKIYLKDGPLVLKEAMGVSGKGMVLIENEKKFAQLLTIMRRSRHSYQDERLEMVLEKWIDKSKDLNYQFMVKRNGGLQFYSVREALVHDRVHFGHVSPMLLTTEQQHTLDDAFRKIGSALYQDGFYGIVGVDAMIDMEGKLFPCLEINARFNMATYQNRILQEWIPASSWIIARPFHVALSENISFIKLRNQLEGHLYRPDKQMGLIINGFSTLNMVEEDGKIKKGRLYTILVGTTLDECQALSDQVEYALKELL